MKQSMARTVRRLAFAGTAYLPGINWFRPRGQPFAVALLFHRFFQPDEPQAKGRERLRRMLDWLRTEYSPISLSQLSADDLSDRSVVVTVDDGFTDLLGVADLFQNFAVPLAAFVCSGGIATASRGTGEDLVSRAASLVQWYEGPETEIRFGRDRILDLSPARKADSLDQLIADRKELLPDLVELCERLEAPATERHQCCTWAELRDLLATGVEIGTHSVSHVAMSRVSPTRRRFEVEECKRVTEALLCPCHAFAYPFGTPDSHSLESRADLQSAGYSSAFLSHSDYITLRTDRLILPRITIPDHIMPLAEFQGRVRGAGIALQRLKSFLR